ncbi:carboxymuconolactone decarboxylase family protein [Metaclostridioides mangenotii]|uniref:carboxymuconolactone decarboxylase family protein n=1 Tax=Metaclostridioides mangenotii TaxID=1540 RepID=UPI0028EAB0D2|nr:carboxymuconolactone decarboxylase family protein [Clostridioides mangenotii]
MINYEEEYEIVAKNGELLGEQSPAVMRKFKGIAGEVLKDNKLSLKTKELVAVGIAISVRCDACILSHVRNAINAGVTMEELAETVEVAILMGGGPSTAYGAKALSIAEHLFKEKK